MKPFTNYQKQDWVIFIKLILPMKCIKLQLKRGKTNVQKDISKSGGRTDFSVSGKRGWTCVVLMNVFVQTEQIIERWWYIVIVVSKHKQSNMASLFISCKGKIDSCLKREPVCSLNFEKVMILIIFFCSLLIGASLLCTYFPIQC